MVSHESDQVEVPPNHAMEDADWVHEGSRWKCGYKLGWLISGSHQVHD